MKSRNVLVCLLCMMAWSTPRFLRADDKPAASPPQDFKQLYEEQKRRNDNLERRLRVLEEHSQQDLDVVKKEVPEETLKKKELPEGKEVPEETLKKKDLPEETLQFLQDTKISGFVSASYFYNFNRPADGMNTGRGFDINHNEFMANKFDLVLEKPVDYDASAWQAGYKAELIFGQDAAFTQAGGLSLGDQGDLFLGYLEVNVPIGKGLKVYFGKYQTVIGYEYSETELNANWSGGNQWTILEPFTHTGLLLSYKWSELFETQILVNNGWDIVKDNNRSKSFMGIINFTPNDDNFASLTAFGGPEQAGNNANWRKGVDLVVTHKFTPKFSTAVQIDYGQEDGAKVVGSTVDADGNLVPVISGGAQWWGAGLWLTYDFSETLSTTLRSDYVNDINGARTSQAPVSAPFPINTGQELYSLTLTVNVKPFKGLRIAPEIRWDHSTLGTAFGGHEDQVTVGLGAAYFF